MLIALAVVATAPVALADEGVWPTNSASDLSIHVALLRFRIYTDHCSAHVPHLKPRFESLMQALRDRVQGLSVGLLASDEFSALKDKPVPVEVVDAFKDSFHDLRHNFERRDAAAACSTTLQRIGEMDDDSLKLELTVALTAVQNMIRNLENAGAR